MFLFVHTGRMEAVCLERIDAAHYIEKLRGFRRRHRLRGVYLVQDGGSSHVSAKTNDFFAEGRGCRQPRRTPVHASWLDQAELLIRDFSRRYAKRRSWISREQVIEQVEASWPEYKRLYSHPSSGP